MKQRTRLTREDTQKQTRQRLLDAARDEIVRGGIAAATVRGISEAAGYSQGAFYSNFANKDALFEILMNNQMEKLTEAFDETVRDLASGDLEKAMIGIADWLTSLHNDDNASSLILELQMYANHNPSFGIAFGKRKSHYVVSFSNTFEKLFHHYGITPPLSAMHASIGFMALWHGFSMQKTKNYPAATSEVYLAFLQALFGKPISAAAHTP